jgi:hypothetical protein
MWAVRRGEFFFRFVLIEIRNFCQKAIQNEAKVFAKTKTKKWVLGAMVARGPPTAAKL